MRETGASVLLLQGTGESLWDSLWVYKSVDEQSMPLASRQLYSETLFSHSCLECDLETLLFSENIMELELFHFRRFFQIYQASEMLTQQLLSFFPHTYLSS